MQLLRKCTRKSRATGHHSFHSDRQLSISSDSSKKLLPDDGGYRPFQSDESGGILILGNDDNNFEDDDDDIFYSDKPDFEYSQNGARSGSVLQAYGSRDSVRIE